MLGAVLLGGLALLISLVNLSTPLVQPEVATQCGSPGIFAVNETSTGGLQCLGLSEATSFKSGQTTPQTIVTYTPNSRGMYQVGCAMVRQSFVSGSAMCEVNFLDFTSGSTFNIDFVTLNSGMGIAGATTVIFSDTSHAITCRVVGTFSLTYDASCYIALMASP